ncbi:hypothetical protein QBC46DRAFT_379072 [Diplogelasinospora grovesii]|uniref:Ketoreductase domain-containing protein n=1 Tax=Diplogelasinospora grovesii TaxID=303347 RepID=A0AAN6ND83_9PEZI|nr:hypothetical protein QBC46DRAFT_379072 [Diplogelasinospora grovesii]
MAPDTLSLEGKVAIITGSGKENGIGAGIARALARNGARVTLNHVSEASGPRAANLAKELRQLGGEATVVQADMSTAEGCKKLVDETLKAFNTQTINILVNNAAWSQPEPIMTMGKDTVERTFAVGVYGPLYMIQATVPRMPRGGRIINVGSVASKIGFQMLPLYAASKGAMDTLAYSMAMELGRDHGITINTVAPGPVSTDAILPEHQDAMFGFFLPKTRAEERVGTIEDIGDAVLLLACEKSRWITGQTISVSGGITGN